MKKILYLIVSVLINCIIILLGCIEAWLKIFATLLSGKSKYLEQKGIGDEVAKGFFKL